MKSRIVKRLLKWTLYPFFRQYIRMPGESHTGPLPGFTHEELAVAENSRRHVQVLAVDIGERSRYNPVAQGRCIDYIISQLAELGYEISTESYTLSTDASISVRNIVADLPGADEETLVLGAHYDTVTGCPGADDNATGVAGLLELARMLKRLKLRRKVRFAFFGNEEEREVWKDMGSYKHASLSSARKDRIMGMLSLEMLGYFSDLPDSQLYPFPFNLFYPETGNFIAFVGNKKSKDFVAQVVGLFRENTPIPSEGAAPPERFADIARSDHWSFWQFGWPALMITDTSNFRFVHLHGSNDTIDKVDFNRMARVVVGVRDVVLKLVGTV